MNNFDVLKEMGRRNMKIGLSPLENIVNLKKVKNGTQVTIGVAGDLVAALGIEHKFVGGLILADKEQFNAVKSELGKLPQIGESLDQEDWSNAHLIVSAPDLLEACKRMLIEMEACKLDAFGTLGETHFYDEANYLRALIAKAEGTQEPSK